MHEEAVDWECCELPCGKRLPLSGLFAQTACSCHSLVFLNRFVSDDSAVWIYLTQPEIILPVTSPLICY